MSNSFLCVKKCLLEMWFLSHRNYFREEKILFFFWLSKKNCGKLFCFCFEMENCVCVATFESTCPVYLLSSNREGAYSNRNFYFRVSLSLCKRYGFFPEIVFKRYSFQCPEWLDVANSIFFDAHAHSCLMYNI